MCSRGKLDYLYIIAKTNYNESHLPRPKPKMYFNYTSMFKKKRTKTNCICQFFNVITLYFNNKETLFARML